ncbi:hypothetical protein Baya_1129 [Bagarius yarrelli]|uniref:Uncharacterized protein n=1 Tax=Bagarius yarrelli TaxID=175774 RepID=A0A556TK78_BAGYA|nr:hypothetical protein Baya_1129 [Bagarius yarrelli]
MLRLQVCVVALYAALCLCSGGRGGERERVVDEEDGADGGSRSCRDVKQALVDRGFTAIRMNQQQSAGKFQGTGLGLSSLWFLRDLLECSRTHFMVKTVENRRSVNDNKVLKEEHPNPCVRSVSLSHSLYLSPLSFSFSN